MLAVDTVQGLLNLTCCLLPIVTYAEEEAVSASEMFGFERVQHFWWKP